MTETNIPGWDDAEYIDPDQVPDDVNIPGSRPRVDHGQRDEQREHSTDWARSPRSYMVSGQLRTDLFPISAFLEATGLKYSTVRKWENDGVLPRPVLRGPLKPALRETGLKGQRLYSKEFIEGTVTILAEEGVSQSHRNIHMTNFSRRVHALFERTGG